MVAAPRDASTVILLRTAAPQVEVFLVKRHEGMGFFGGSHVFPGGKLDEADRGLGPEDAGRRLRCHTRLNNYAAHSVDASTAAALYASACRELFEECDVLLVNEAWPPKHAGTLAAARDRLNRKETSFADILHERGLSLDFDALAFWAHWITPSIEPKRFDTRFFVARMPSEQTTKIDKNEAVDSCWLSPRRALQAYRNREIMLPPPTYRNLEELSDVLGTLPVVSQSDADTVVRHLQGRAVLPIQPKIASGSDGVAILLPWDPDYEGSSGEALEPSPSYPQSWVEGPSRIELVNGFWASRQA